MKLGLAGWSLQSHFRRDENPIALLDYPQLARDEWGFEAVELNNIFMASHDDSYVDELKSRAEKANVALWGMAVDGTGSLCDDDSSTRSASIDNCVVHLKIGQRLGLDYMRFNSGGDVEPTESQIENCIDSFRQLASHGEKLGVKVCIENHGGLSRFPDPIVAVMRGVDSPWCRTLPDWGNFPAEIRLEALEKVMPFAVACHAKFWNFDNGHDAQMPVGEIKQICERVGFDGRLAIEWEGDGDSAFSSLHTAKALLSQTFA